MESHCWSMYWRCWTGAGLVLLSLALPGCMTTAPPPPKSGSGGSLLKALQRKDLEIQRLKDENAILHAERMRIDMHGMVTREISFLQWESMMHNFNAMNELWQACLVYLRNHRDSVLMDDFKECCEKLKQGPFKKDGT